MQFEQLLVKHYHLPQEVITTLQHKEVRNGWFAFSAAVDIQFTALEIRLPKREIVLPFKDSYIFTKKQLEQLQANPREVLKSYEEQCYCPALMISDSEVLVDEHGNSEDSLVWLPRLKMFGNYNAEDSLLKIFPGVSWEEIYEHPKQYLYHPAVFNRTSKKQGVILYEALADWQQYVDFLPQTCIESARTITPDNINTMLDKELGVYDQLIKQFPFEDYKDVLHSTNDSLSDIAYSIARCMKGLSQLCGSAGNEFYNTGKYEQALYWLEKRAAFLHSLSEKEPGVLYYLPETSSHLEARYNSAIYYLDFIHGMCYFKLANYNKAIYHFTQYSQLSPDDAKNYFYLGLAYQSMANQGKAMASYQKAIDLKIENPYAYSNMAICVAALSQDYNQAIALTREAITIAPQEANFYFNLACYYSLQQQTQQAIDSLEKALQLGYKKLEKIISEPDLQNIIHLKETQLLLQRYFRDYNNFSI